MSGLKVLYALISKNLKQLIRAKSSSLVIVLGPLLLVFLAGIAFDNSGQYSLDVGIYAPRYTESIENIYDALDDKFRVKEFFSEKSCNDAILANDIHACILFPSNFTIGKPGLNEIVFITDYSRVNLVWTITTVIGEEMGETVSDVSKDLTKVLLDAIEFTNDRVAKQRAVLVQLTTENEIISESASALRSDLSELDLTFKVADFAGSNITSAKKKVEHWVTNAFTLAEKSLTKASSFISSADSAAGKKGSDVQEALQGDLESSVDKIAKLKEDLATSKDLAQTNFKQFDDELSSLVNQLSSTKQRFQEADASRELSVRVISAVMALLDKSLINVLEVQHGLNEIDNKLNSIEVTDAASVVQPIVTSVRPVVAESSYLTYLFPSLIILVIMFTAFIVSPTLVLLERHSPAYFRSVMSPVNYSLFYLSSALTSLILLLIQLFIIMAIAGAVFSSQVLAGLPLAIIVLLFSSFTFIFLGMLLGYLFKSEETAVIGGISLGAVFIFLGGMIVPLESMPLWLSSIAKWSPFVVSAELLRAIFVYGTFPWSGFSVLLLYFVLFGVVSFVAFTVSRNRFAKLVMDIKKAKLFRKQK